MRDLPLKKFVLRKLLLAHHFPIVSMNVHQHRYEQCSKNAPIGFWVGPSTTIGALEVRLHQPTGMSNSHMRDTFLNEVQAILRKHGIQTALSHDQFGILLLCWFPIFTKGVYATHIAERTKWRVLSINERTDTMCVSNTHGEIQKVQCENFLLAE